MAEPLDEAVAKHQKGMRIFLRDERPIGSVQERLKVRGEGEVSLVLILDNGEREVEVKLPGTLSGLAADRGRAAGGAGGGRGPDELRCLPGGWKARPSSLLIGAACHRGFSAYRRAHPTRGACLMP